MSAHFSRLHAVCTAAAMACLLVIAHGSAVAQKPPAAEDAEPITVSAMDGQLFYQLLLGEMALNSGDPATAYPFLIAAARNSSDAGVYQRAAQAAMASNSPNRAMEAIRAWRSAHPSSRDALQFQLQVLLNQKLWTETIEPLQTLLKLSPPAERNATIGSLPSLFGRNPDKAQAEQLMAQVLEASLQDPTTQVAAQAALGRAALAAGDAPRALERAQRALAQSPTSEAGALLALELMEGTPTAEPLVQNFMKAAPTHVPMRLVYARLLSAAQRYADAAQVLGEATRLDPERAAPWLTLGAIELELKHPKEATLALTRYVRLAQKNGAAPLPTEADESEEGVDTAPDQGLTQAYLLLARLAEQQRDFKGAEAWLAKVKNPDRALEVQSRRAGLMARQGQLKAARELIRRVPEKAPEDARAKLVAEAQLLRDLKRWAEAEAVLEQANQRFPDDTELIYEQAMVAEKLNRLAEMERLLRKIITLKPDYHHAYNALGYSLADRRQRMPEARELIRKALELAPGDPFITDSLGWAEYRLGNRDEALRLLQQAYRSRPDVEIAAHLGELLWVTGQQNEAQRVWRDAKKRDAANEVLRATLGRLKVKL